MTYDRRHVLAQWGGTLPGGEIWSNSVRLGSSGLGDGAPVPTHSQMEDWVHGSGKDAVQAFHNAADTKVHNTAKLTFLKMNVVGLDGRYVDLNTVEHVYAPPVLGASFGNQHPNQVTLVVSLTTEFSRGRAHRGRFYLPLPAMGVDSSGLVLAADAAGVAGTASTFLEDLGDAPGIDVGVFAMRVLVMSKIGTGTTNPVMGVEVGRTLDTQRRRRNELPEDYQAHAVDQG